MKIYCDECKNEMKKSFRSYSVIKCKKCNNEIDFSDNRKVFRFFYAYKVIITLFLVEVALLLRPIIQRELGVSYILSVLIVLLAGSIAGTILIHSMHCVIISKLYKLLHKENPSM